MSKHDKAKKLDHDDHGQHDSAVPRHTDDRSDGHDEVATPEVRVEVIANRSVQEDLFERLGKRGVGGRYT
ncbi:MAG: hypothetical protein ACOCYQ_02315, partial [Alkalispirochaeta sp.]